MAEKYLIVRSRYSDDDSKPLYTISPDPIPRRELHVGEGTVMEPARIETLYAENSYRALVGPPPVREYQITTPSLTVAVLGTFGLILAAITSLALGFAAGYVCAKPKKAKEDE